MMRTFNFSASQNNFNKMRFSLPHSGFQKGTERTNDHGMPIAWDNLRSAQNSSCRLRGDTSAMMGETSGSRMAYKMAKEQAEEQFIESKVT